MYQELVEGHASTPTIFEAARELLQHSVQHSSIAHHLSAYDGSTFRHAVTATVIQRLDHRPIHARLLELFRGASFSQRQSRLPIHEMRELSSLLK